MRPEFIAPTKTRRFASWIASHTPEVYSEIHAAGTLVKIEFGSQTTIVLHRSDAKVVLMALGSFGRGFSFTEETGIRWNVSLEATGLVFTSEAGAFTVEDIGGIQQEVLLTIQTREVS